MVANTKDHLDDLGVPDDRVFSEGWEEGGVKESYCRTEISHPEQSANRSTARRTTISCRCEPLSDSTNDRTGGH
jgi:hypothetical protein